MSEDAYRLTKAIVLAVFVIGVLIIGWRWSNNGRYQQIDSRKSGSQIRPLPVIDTQSGEIRDIYWEH